MLLWLLNLRRSPKNQVLLRSGSVTECRRSWISLLSTCIAVELVFLIFCNIILFWTYFRKTIYYMINWCWSKYVQIIHICSAGSMIRSKINPLCNLPTCKLKKNDLCFWLICKATLQMRIKSIPPPDLKFKCVSDYPLKHIQFS